MIEQWLSSAVGVVWNYPVVGFCLFAGLFCTIRLGFIQLHCFKHALQLISGRYDHQNEPGNLTHFQALSAALSGTVGLGNIAGVAIAIGMGGPGAVFWLWIVGFMGMATKFMECTLGTIYRHKDPETGTMKGGGMFYITEGLGEKWRPMAIFFAACLTLGAFGAANMFQSNQVAIATAKYLGMPHWLTGLLIASVLGATILGGIKRIGLVASRVVPTMCGLYLLMTLLFILMNITKIPAAFAAIITDAFTGWAIAGGSVGAVIITGVRRSVFSNEAGLGTAPIAHATVKTDYPVREGVVASLGPFIDTIVVCTATALVIIMSGMFGTEMHETVAETPIAQSSMSGGWQLDDQAPADTDRLQSFRNGAETLAVHQPRRRAVALTSPVSILQKEGHVARKNQERKESHVADGMRFSCHRNEGLLSVALIDDNGRMVDRLSVGHDGDHRTVLGKKGSEHPLLSISPCPEHGGWHSHVITFHPHFKAQVAKAAGGMDNMRLQFVADQGTRDWYVDRVQSIENVEGVALTTAAFHTKLGDFGTFFITLAIILFCYSTMVTWSFYGEVAISFVFGNKGARIYRLLFVAAAYFGAVLKLTPVLNFSDLMLGLMVVPNFIAIMMLSGEVQKRTQEYFRRLNRGEFEPQSTQTARSVAG